MTRIGNSYGPHIGGDPELHRATETALHLLVIGRTVRDAFKHLDKETKAWGQRVRHETRGR